MLRQIITLLLIALLQANANALPQTNTGQNNLRDIFGGIFSKPKLLPQDEAFQFDAQITGNILHLNWLVADGYYLYRDKFQVSIAEASTKLGKFTLPKGAAHTDLSFGEVQILRGMINLPVPLLRIKPASHITLTAQYQGCADLGVCYPPIKKTLTLALPAVANASTPGTSDQTLSIQDTIAASIGSSSFILTLLSFFGFGLLLSFTPCIFPMIPILSGIIVRHGANITTKSAFLLSLCYVVASATTYAVFGVLAALFGASLQVAIQQTWVIALFSGVFVLLALSMFGFFKLQLPSAWQQKIQNSNQKFSNGSYYGAAVMGALSSLIIGPCVAAPLAGALLYIGNTGDTILGGSALFVLGLGMGVPLLLMGASAGKLLPKAGAWLGQVQAVFGVGMLAVALLLLERILPTWLTVLLAAALLIIPAIYAHALDPLPADSGKWRKFGKGLAVIALVYGVLLLIGLAAGNARLLQPLSGIGIGNPAPPELVWQKVSSGEQLDTMLTTASANGQWLMLDFYADWCISCKEMEVLTFTNSDVQQALAGFALVKADVTANLPGHQALLKRFGLIGPPAILFFNPTNSTERRNLRIIGYQNVTTFLHTIKRLQDG